MQQLLHTHSSFAPATFCRTCLPDSRRKQWGKGRILTARKPSTLSGRGLRQSVVVTASKAEMPEDGPDLPNALASAFGVAWKAALLAPAIAVAAAGCSQAYATSGVHAQVTSSVASVNRFAASSVASAVPTATAALSTAVSSPVLRVTGLVSSVAVAGAMAMTHKKKSSTVARASKDDSVAEVEEPKEQKKGVPEPAVLALGLAALMVESFSPTKPKLSSDRIVEAVPPEEEMAGDEATAPSRKAVKQFLASARKSKASDDKKYDPIRSIFQAGAKSGESAIRDFLKSIEYKGDGRYDLLQDLFTKMREEGIATDSKYDPICAFLNMPVPTSSHKWDPVRSVRSFARHPRTFVANKFDFLVSFFKGRWQTDNQRLGNLPAWDPVSVLHDSAGQPISHEPNKYNAVDSILKGDIAEIPEWDPVFGFLKGMNAKEGSVRSKYDPATMALTGNWMEANMSLKGVPEWDPVSGVQKAAREPVDFGSNKYDFAEVFLRGAWQNSVAGLSNLAKWDPVSGFVNLATSTATYAIPKFDILSVVLQGKKDVEAEEVQDGSRKEAAKSSDAQKKVGLSDEMRADLLNNISALTKEVESAGNSLDTLFS